MTELDLYETKRTVLIVDSADDFFRPGDTHTVYMNKVSTVGILDDKGRFISLPTLKYIGVDWEYINYAMNYIRG